MGSIVSLRTSDKQAINITTLACCESCFVICVLNTTLSPISEGFQWSYHQQASHVFNVVLGSNVSLPCEYVLTPQEQQEANIFHLLTWTREQPFNSDNWAGLAIKSTLTGSKVIHDDPQHIFMTNGALNVTNVSIKDHTRYQCAFQSSFFATPSIIELNVQCKCANITFINHPSYLMNRVRGPRTLVLRAWFEIYM